MNQNLKSTQNLQKLEVPDWGQAQKCGRNKHFFCERDEQSFFLYLFQLESCYYFEQHGSYLCLSNLKRNAIFVNF